MPASAPELEATKESTSPSRLTELARQNRELARLVAQNPGAPANLLAELSTSRDGLTRQAVASNPNIPTETLFALGAEFPQEFLDNPIFALLYLEHPDWIKKLPEDCLEALLKMPQAPLWLFEQTLRVRTGSTILCLLAENPSTPLILLEELASKVNISVRIALAGRPQLPLPILEKLAVDSYGIVRWRIAEHSLTPISLLEKLATDSVGYIRASVAANPNTPLATLKHLARDPLESVRAHVVQNPNTDSSSLQLFSRETNFFVLKSLACNPQIPPSMLEKLASHPQAKVRKIVAQNPSITPVAAQKLTRSHNLKVRYHLANNPQTPIPILVELAGILEDIHRAEALIWVRVAIANNPNTPIATLNSLARDRAISVRQAARTNIEKRLSPLKPQT